MKPEIEYRPKRKTVAVKKGKRVTLNFPNGKTITGIVDMTLPSKTETMKVKKVAPSSDKPTASFNPKCPVCIAHREKNRINQKNFYDKNAAKAKAS